MDCVTSEPRASSGLSTQPLGTAGHWACTRSQGPRRVGGPVLREPARAHSTCRCHGCRHPDPVPEAACPSPSVPLSPADPHRHPPDEPRGAAAAARRDGGKGRRPGAPPLLSWSVWLGRFTQEQVWGWPGGHNHRPESPGVREPGSPAASGRAGGRGDVPCAWGVDACGASLPGPGPPVPASSLPASAGVRAPRPRQLLTLPHSPFRPWRASWTCMSRLYRRWRQTSPRLCGLLRSLFGEMLGPAFGPFFFCGVGPIFYWLLIFIR